MSPRETLVYLAILVGDVGIAPAPTANQAAVLLVKLIPVIFGTPSRYRTQPISRVKAHSPLEPEQSLERTAGIEPA